MADYMPEEPLPEAMFEGEFYRWSCRGCEDVRDEEFDPRGLTVDCPTCGLVQRVQS